MALALKKIVSLVALVPNLSIEPAKLIGLWYECRRWKGICSADLQVGTWPDAGLKPGAMRAKLKNYLLQAERIDQC